MILTLKAKLFIGIANTAIALFAEQFEIRSVRDQKIQSQAATETRALEFESRAGSGVACRGCGRHEERFSGGECRGQACGGCIEAAQQTSL